MSDIELFVSFHRDILNFNILFETKGIFYLLVCVV